MTPAPLGIGEGLAAAQMFISASCASQPHRVGGTAVVPPRDALHSCQLLCTTYFLDLLLSRWCCSRESSKTARGFARIAFQGSEALHGIEPFQGDPAR